MPELKPGDVVVMGNLSSPKDARVRALIKAAHASIRYLPPYDHDFKPIENAFAKLKALLRKIVARTQDTLFNALGKLIDHITSAECANMLAAAG